MKWKKSFYLIILFFLLSSGLVSAYLFLPNYFQTFDATVRDFYFKIRGTQTPSDAIVIVDIDEKSIKALGQWPWERVKFARILKNLTEMKAGIIGLDIIFSESDKTSPQSIAKQWDLNATNLPNYDDILAKTVASTPTILGYVFDFNTKNDNEAPELPLIVVEKSKPKEEFLPEAKGVLTNIPKIQNAAYSSGFINNIPDASGVIRSVPTLIRYDMEAYTSLAFELYRLGIGAKKITINYSQAGVNNIQLGNTTIPTDRFGRVYLNFKGPSKTYRYISAIDVYNKTVDPTLLEGKFVLIGTSAYGLMDLRATPLDNVLPGVEIHATLIDNLLNHDMLQKPNWSESADIAAILLIVFVIVFLYSRFGFFTLVLIFFATLAGYFWLYYYLLFDKHIVLNVLFPILAFISSIIGVLAINYLFEFKQKELIKGSFSKKVSKQVMEDLLKRSTGDHLSSQEVIATVYFSDVRSFTTISENLGSPKRITDFLNYYLNALVIPIEKHRGTVDKFIGDAIMAYWNAPLPVENHADEAVQAALEQLEKRDEINITIKEKFGFEVDFGIGINTGEVVVGEIGSTGRSDYTMIGDAVNLASRLEGLCKAYKVRLIISEFTKEALKFDYTFMLLDIVIVKGKNKPVKIYEVLSKGLPSDEIKEELRRYQDAHSLYMEANFEQAQKAFEELYTEFGKYLYDLYAKRCERLKEEKIEHFDGVYRFTTK